MTWTVAPEARSVADEVIERGRKGQAVVGSEACNLAGASYKLTTLVQRASRQTWVNTGHSPGPFLEAREYVILLSQGPIGLPQSS